MRYSPGLNSEVESSGNGSWLKKLREDKKMSRMELSKATNLSPYQIEGLEGQGVYRQIVKVHQYISALGYRIEDVFKTMHLHGENGSAQHIKGNFIVPLAQTKFDNDVCLVTYLDTEKFYVGQIDMGVGTDKVLNRDRLPSCESMLGVVREGVVSIESLYHETIYKKDHFFVLPGNLPAEFVNVGNVTRVKIFIFLNR